MCRRLNSDAMSALQGSSRASGRSRKRKPTDMNDKPRKRTKTAVACRVCRAKKSKCDGFRPGKHYRRRTNWSKHHRLMLLLIPPSWAVCGPCVRREGDRAALVCSYRTTIASPLVSDQRWVPLRVMSTTKYHKKLTSGLAICPLYTLLDRRENHLEIT